MADSTEKQYLDKDGIKKIFSLLKTEFNEKVDNNKLVPLTIDEYNALGENIDNDAFYFIIDEDDTIFDKVNELYTIIDVLKTDLKEVQDFVNQFPVDNRTYGIINKQPKDLSAVFPELAMPSDKDEQDTPN